MTGAPPRSIRDGAASIAPSAASTTEARDALEVLAGLPVHKRTVLTLQVSGHSYTEIAAPDMTERTVQVHL